MILVTCLIFVPVIVHVVLAVIKCIVGEMYISYSFDDFSSKTKL